MTGNRSEDAGRYMSPSNAVPSGICTRTSRSTMTSYFRSDVDHMRVNTGFRPSYETPQYLKPDEMSIHLASRSPCYFSLALPTANCVESAESMADKKPSHG